MERWERELQRLRTVDAPAQTRSRLDAGPTGDGMPPTPKRGQRIAAGLVALVIVVGAGALLASAFRRDDATPIAPTVQPAVLTLEAEPNDAVATLAYGGVTVDAPTGSYCWTQEQVDGSTGEPVSRTTCRDVAEPKPFAPEAFLEVARGTRFVLENEDGADPIDITVTAGADPMQNGDAIDLDSLSGLAVGEHVLTVTAGWEGRGEHVTFWFPLRIVQPSSDIATPSEPTPTATDAPSPGSADQRMQEILWGSSWSLAEIDGARLDIERPPTLIFGTLRLGGFTGCNSYGADAWSVEAGRLRITDPVMTMIGCQGQTGALEERFLAILDSDPNIVMNPTNLSLSSEAGKMLLDRIDVDHDDIVGSFLDCAWWDRVDLMPPGQMRAPTPPTVFTVNLPWIEATDEIRQIGQTGRWIVVREGSVIAEIWEDYLGRRMPELRRRLRRLSYTENRTCKMSPSATT